MKTALSVALAGALLVGAAADAPATPAWNAPPEPRKFGIVRRKSSRKPSFVVEQNAFPENVLDAVRGESSPAEEARTAGVVPASARAAAVACVSAAAIGGARHALERMI